MNPLNDIKLYKDTDADLSIIQSKKVGIVGYGNQGRAQALNLAESGVDVKIGLRPGSETREQVIRDRLDVLDLSKITKWADVISILIL